MKHLPKLAAPVLFLPVLAAMGAVAESPAFSPEEGTSLTKRIVKRTETGLDDMTVSMNGQDQSGMVGDTTIDTTQELTIVVTDVYEGVGDGRPTRLRRTFDELGSETVTEAEMMGQSGGETEVSGSSDLEGLSVVFTWDEDEEDYSVAFADDSGGDDELLEDLSAQMDFTALLPEGDVSEGDTWGVDVDVMSQVLAPGGSLKIAPDEMGGMGMMGSQSPLNPAEFFEYFDGEVTVQFSGVREVGDARVAVLEVQVDVSSAADMTEYVSEMMESAEMPEGLDVEMDVSSFDMEYQFEGSGELLWDLGAGVLHSFELSGDVDNVVDTTMSMAMGGQEMEIEQSMSLSGTDAITVTIED